MASFTTRVLLRGGLLEAEYESLHSAMQQRNFTRTIISNDGITYKLPHAEYNIIGSYSKEQVLGLAMEAVQTLPNRVAEVLVTESSGRTWNNLQRT